MSSPGSVWRWGVCVRTGASLVLAYHTLIGRMEGNGRRPTTGSTSGTTSNPVIALAITGGNGPVVGPLLPSKARRVGGYKISPTPPCWGSLTRAADEGRQANWQYLVRPSARMCASGCGTMATRETGSKGLHTS